MTRTERKEYNYWLSRRKVKEAIEKKCTQCDEWKEETKNFYLRNKSKPEIGYSPECKTCASKRAVKWNESNPEKYMESKNKYHKSEKGKEILKVISKSQNEKGAMIKWRKDHPEKCREYSKLHRQHDITEAEWRSCLSIFENTCAYCGLPIEKHIVVRNNKYIVMNFHKEHVDDKGYNDLRNAVPSCLSCNSSKHQDSLDDWYPKQKFFTEERYNKIIWWINKGYKEFIEEKPPYRMIRKQNEGLKTFHWELWSVDEKRNVIELINIGDKKKDLDIGIIP